VIKIKGKIIKGIGGFYYVDTDDGIFECKARGIFRKKKKTPLVGDNVEIQIVDKAEYKAVIEKIEKRDTELFRPSIANINKAIIVFAIKNPNPNYSLLDRFIVLAEESNLDIVICINKIELDEEETYKKIVDEYSLAGYKVIPTSVKKNINIDIIKEELKGNINVFAGPSGVGKSSLLNIIDDRLDLKTGIVSEKIGRGKHTTRHAELIKIDEETFVADTPGFSSLSIDFIEESELKYYFLEFDKYECRFKNSCIHENEPGCGVKEALLSGDISNRRYESYLYLLNEIRNSKNRRY
jgi:ribosome biogenesis GTPase